MRYLSKLIYTLRNRLYDVFIKIYLLFCRKFKKKCIGLTGDVDVVVSLTSYYKRFPTLKWTLESLFQQKSNFTFKLILVLSHVDIDKNNGLPSCLDEYLERGLELIVVPENLKSYKKAFYSIDELRPLITVDDDIFYPSWWLDKIMKESLKTPHSVLAYRAHYMLFENGNISPYVNWLHWSEKNFLPEEKYSLLPTGTSGVFYPVGALSGLNETKDAFMKICPDADDLWFKYLTVINGFKARRIFHKNIHFHVISQGETLFSQNVHQGGNDIQFRNLLKYSEVFSERIKSDLVNVE